MISNIGGEFLPSARLTRYFSEVPPIQLQCVLSHALEDLVAKFLIITEANRQGGHITFSTVDRRRCPLLGDIRIQRIGSNDLWLVLFVRRKGDPLEFKRFYKAITSHDQVQPTTRVLDPPAPTLGNALNSTSEEEGTSSE